MNYEPTVAPKTTIQQLQEEARKEYAHEFGGPVLKNGRMAQFLDSLIEKAFTAGKEETEKEWIEALEKGGAIVMNMKKMNNELTARTNKSLD